jgi:hypothetical protein
MSPSSSGLENEHETSRRRQFSLAPASAVFLLGLITDPEVRDNKFFQNVRLSPNYTASQPRRNLHDHYHDNFK